MNPAEFDLNLYRGDTHTWAFVLWQDEDKTIPLDLSDPGIEVNAHIRDKPKPKGITLAVMTAYVSDINQIRLEIPEIAWDDPTNLWPEKKGFWDLEVRWGYGPGNLVRTFVAGEVHITPDITDVTP